MTTASPCSSMIRHSTYLPRSPPPIPRLHLSSAKQSSNWSPFNGAVVASSRDHHIHIDRCVVVSCASGDENVNTPSQKEPIALLLEVEGVLMDVYRWGNRRHNHLSIVHFKEYRVDC